MDTVIAGCKINLGLRITGIRDNGYHEINSLFWPLPEPHDTLEVDLVSTPGIHVQCEAYGICPTRNTLTRAYEALAQRVPHLPGVNIILRKGIPPGSGLGGGSSDAAALLQWLNVRMSQPLDAQELTRIALRVGADIPFFLQPFPCNVRGIGEIIEPVDNTKLSGMHLILVCPSLHSSTPQAYADYDATIASATVGQNSLTKSASEANGFFPVTAEPILDLHNDLEAVVFSRYPQLADLKATLLRFGTKVAMSGSGSAIFALFMPKDGVKASAAASILREKNYRVYTHVL